MRKFFFLLVLFITSYCYLLAQQQATEASFARSYQANDLYKIEVIQPTETGYALQVASFSSYPNVLKFATSLQAKWIRNILMRLDETNKNQPVYKVLLGPFASKQQALNYQKKHGLTGFVTLLAQQQQQQQRVSTGIPPSPLKTQETFSTKGQSTSTLFSQVGEASYYSEDFHGRITANGETFDMNALTAAHWTLPFGTPLKVCRLDNGKCVQVRVNDRGPNPAKAIARNGKPRIIDLSLAAAKRIDLVSAGLAQVRIEQLDLRPISVENTKGVDNSNIPATIPASSNSASTQIGEASYYAQKFHGRTTASGEVYDMHALTAAHWTLPFNTRLNVCRLDNGKCVQVRVSDRGPNPAKAFARDGKPRIIDLSFAAAQRIGLVQAGVAQVRVEVLK